MKLYSLGHCKIHELCRSKAAHHKIITYTCTYYFPIHKRKHSLCASIESGRHVGVLWSGLCLVDPQSLAVDIHGTIVLSLRQSVWESNHHNTHHLPIGNAHVAQGSGNPRVLRPDCSSVEPSRIGTALLCGHPGNSHQHTTTREGNQRTWCRQTFPRESSAAPTLSSHGPTVLNLIVKERSSSDRASANRP